MVSPLAQALAFQNSVSPAQTGVAPTDVVGSYKLASDVAEKNYQAKIAQMMGLWGGLASLGSAGLIGSKSLWAPALGKALGVGGSSGAAAAPAAGAADLGTGASLADLTGGTVGDIGGAIPAATIAGDFGGGLGGAAGGSVAADMGLLGGTAGDLAGAVAPTVAADLGTGAAGLAADTAPDWLASFLPFLFA